MKVAVIGGGLAGLNAARILSEYCKVDVYEKNDVGGVASSFCKDYCIEKFYHHFFKEDSYLIELLKELGLKSKIVWRVVRIGQAFKERIYPLNTPTEILRFPALSFFDKIRLALFTLKAKRMNFRDYDEIDVITGLKSSVGEEVTQRFFIPLLKAKFGENYPNVSYAWLLARVSIRSNRKLTGEELGYLRGGLHQFIEKLSENLEIKKEKAEIKYNGKWDVNGKEYDALIYTAPIPELGELKQKLGIRDVKYQSSICLLLGFDEGFTDLYWINYEDEPFGATIEHTNFMPFEDYGEHLMYVASYTTPEKVYEKSDEFIFKEWVNSLKKYGFKGKIRWYKVFRSKYAGPVYEKGYRKLITPYRIRRGFYLAGMTSEANYPERSMNGSLISGKIAAEKLIEDFLS